MSRLTCPRRHDGARQAVGSVFRASRWLLEPLAPLLTCCLLALCGATLSVTMRGAEASNALLSDGNPGDPLDENGSLMNATSTRRLLHEVRPPPVIAAASAGSSAIHADEERTSPPTPPSPANSACTVLTNETAEQLCADLAGGLLPSFSVSEAARRLNHCNVFDFRHLLVHADTLVPSPGQHNCSTMLLTQSERGGFRISKSRCFACLSALIAEDDRVSEMAQLFYYMLDKYQCYIVREDSTGVGRAPATTYSLLTTSSPASSTTLSSSSSSPIALNRQTNTTGIESAAVFSTHEVPMTPKLDPGSSDCAACKVAYSGWLCTKNFKIHPFSTMSAMGKSNRFLAVEACPNWCAAVETACPYFTPGEDQQNGGEPVFLCDEAHYHHSSHYRVPSDPCKQDSRRHTCCYTRQDTDCRPLNKTCPSMREVCLSLAPSVETATNAATDSAINTSTSSLPALQSSPVQQEQLQSQQQQQKQQYLAQPQNVILDTNATSSSLQPPPASSADRRSRPVSCAPLLLTAFLLLSCCPVRELLAPLWTSHCLRALT